MKVIPKSPSPAPAGPIHAEPAHCAKLPLRVSTTMRPRPPARITQAPAPPSGPKSVSPQAPEAKKPKEDLDKTLRNAALNGSSADVRKAIMRGADVNQVDSDGQTALHFASWNANAEAILELISAGADPNKPDGFGVSPYWYAGVFGYRGGSARALAAFQKSGAALRDADRHGNTQLHIALRKGDMDVAQKLLGGGANMDALNIFGETPRDWISENNRWDLLHRPPPVPPKKRTSPAVERSRKFDVAQALRDFAEFDIDFTDADYLKRIDDLTLALNIALKNESIFVSLLNDRELVQLLKDGLSHPSSHDPALAKLRTSAQHLLDALERARVNTKPDNRAPFWPTPNLERVRLNNAGSIKDVEARLALTKDDSHFAPILVALHDLEVTKNPLELLAKIKTLKTTAFNYNHWLGPNKAAATALSEAATRAYIQQRGNIENWARESVIHVGPRPREPFLPAKVAKEINVVGAGGQVTLKVGQEVGYKLAKDQKGMILSFAKEKKERPDRALISQADFDANFEKSKPFADFKPAIELPIFNGLPSPDDINQRAIGDCYLLAALASLARREPERIRDMIHDYQDYALVRLVIREGAGKKEYWIQVDKTRAQSEKSKVTQAAGNVLWPALIEKALAIHFGLPLNLLNGSGSVAQVAIFNTLGLTRKNFPIELGKSPVYEKRLFGELKRRLDTKSTVTASTRIGEEWPSHKQPGIPPTGLVSGWKTGHAYEVVSASRNNAGVIEVVLRNPWGHKGSEFVDGRMQAIKAPTVTMPISEFIRYFRAVQSAE